MRYTHPADLQLARHPVVKAVVQQRRESSELNHRLPPALVVDLLDLGPDEHLAGRLLLLVLALFFELLFNTHHGHGAELHRCGLDEGLEWWIVK